MISAYGGRCAISGVPESLLLDAAHIAADKNEEFGQPIIQNGLPLTKLHHAAFDNHLLGVTADYEIVVSDRLMDIQDGPTMEAMKGLNGRRLILPARLKDYPDPDRLALRFEVFREHN